MGGGTGCCPVAVVTPPPMSDLIPVWECHLYVERIALLREGVSGLPQSASRGVAMPTTVCALEGQKVYVVNI